MENTRRCIVCGKEFIPKRGRHTKYPACSNECKQAIKDADSPYQISEYDLAKLHSKPTLGDKIFVVDILYDFGIVLDELPEFDTVSNLHRWKKDKIRKVLDE